MRFLPKPHPEGRKATESVMFADMDIVSLMVRWTRDTCREPPSSLSSLKDESHNESISPVKGVRGEQR
jgi:hypothetical protein